MSFESDWNPASTISVHQWGLRIADPEQVVLASEPYRRLSYIWHTFTPEWREMARERVGFTEQFLDRIAAERRSKATVEIEDLGELVKLTVIHDGFEAGSEVLETISQGWPHLLSNLKTLLERETLPDSATPSENVAAAASSSRGRSSSATRTQTLTMQRAPLCWRGAHAVGVPLCADRRDVRSARCGSGRGPERRALPSSSSSISCICRQSLNDRDDSCRVGLLSRSEPGLPPR